MWAGYIRVSRVGDRAERLISPELQEQRIRQAAARAGVEVEVQPPELDVSGGRTERPILGRVIQGIERGTYEGVIVAQLDRFSRMGLADAVRTVERIENAGGRIISDAENVDPTTPEGEFARNMFFSIANMQLGRSKHAFAAAKRQAVERGYWPTNTAPLGYTLTHRKHGGDGKLHPDPETRHLPRLAMELRAVGKSWSEIGKAIGRGPTGAGKVVRNRAYLGEIRLEVKGEVIVNPSAHEPLVDRALFEAAQISHPPPERRGNEPALLAGIIRCAGCGCVMSRNTAKSGRFYCCRPNKARRRCPAPAIIGVVGVERYVQEQFLAVIETMQLEQVDDRADGVRDAQAELADAEAERDAFMRSVSAAGIGLEHAAAGMRERVDRVERAQRALAAAWSAQQPSGLPEKIVELWWDFPVEERRHVLRSSLSAITVRKGKGGIPGRVGFVWVDDAHAAEMP